jgi:hypothetical protein
MLCQYLPIWGLRILVVSGKYRPDMSESKIKRIVVLANSVKRNHWCLAGKELFGEEGNWTPGLWVRPVDPAHEGAVTAETMRLGENRLPRFLDIVDVPILKHAQDANHPEDWAVDASRRWEHRGMATPADLPKLVDHPPHLWKGWMDARKVRGGYVSKMMQPASLYLINPKQGARVVVFWDEATKRVKKRLHLRHQGQDHEFDVTDPTFEGRYLGSRRPQAETCEVALPADGRLYLCLSLTPEFHEAHYKIAATIWEAPPA